MRQRGKPTAAPQGAVHKVRSVRAVGTRAVLAELSGTQDVLALQALLLEKPLPGQLDVLAAAETVLVTGRFARLSARRIAARLLQLDLTAPVQREGELVVIDTVYDGEDLAEVGRLTGLGTEGVIAAHSGQVWTVAFAGFAPGFGYMVGENQRLEVPRRSSPRTAVPAGSVALAGNYSAVYPRSSPGGWQLIGRTGAQMWDLDREQPALAAPGHRVQFRAVRDALSTAGVRSPPPVWPRTPGRRTSRPVSRILSPGLQSLIQDLGRHGHSGLGVSAAGALDRASLRRANRLVGQCAVGRRDRDRRRRAQGPGRRGPGPRRRRGAVGTGHRAARRTRRPGERPAPDRADGHPLRPARRRNPHHRRAGERLPQLPRRPRRRGRRPGAGQPLHRHHVRDRPGTPGRRAGPCRRRGRRVRRRRESRTAAGLPGHRRDRARRRPRPARRLVRRRRRWTPSAARTGR